MWHPDVYLPFCTVAFRMWPFEWIKKPDKYFVAFSAIYNCQWPSLMTSNAAFFPPTICHPNLSVQHKERIKISTDFTIWCSCLTSFSSPNTIPLYLKITFGTLREHMYNLYTARLVCCVSESRLIIHIPVCWGRPGVVVESRDKCEEVV